jgi:hypothetical protein
VLATPGRTVKRVITSLAPEPATKQDAPGLGTAAGQGPAALLGVGEAAPLDPEEEAQRAVRREKRERERQRYAAVRRARQAGEAIPGAYPDFVRRVESALGVGADDAVRGGPLRPPG